MAEKIGFVGVGRMGGNMARRLKECGYEIAAVYDVNTEAAQALASEWGCLATGGLELVTSLCDVVFTVVTDDRAMKHIYKRGLLRGASDKLFINCATVTPDVHVWVEAKAAQAVAREAEFVDAVRRPRRPGGPGQGARQHGHEHQYGGPGGGPGAGRRP